MKQVSPVNAWYRAVRPFTLSASVVPVLVGGSLAMKDGYIDISLFLLTLFGSMLIQIGTNLIDESSDYAGGSYTSKFPAPHRVIHRGLLSARSVKLGAYVCFGMAALIGVYLISVAGWPILAVGLASIAAGYFYAGGPVPLGNLALGEPLVFLFMGPAAVLSTYYIQARHLSWEAAVLSLPVACLVTAILVANNLRDVEEDRGAGKTTIATLFGVRAAALAYIGLVMTAFVVVVVSVVSGLQGVFSLLPVIGLVWGAPLVRMVWRERESHGLNMAVKKTAAFHLQFGLFMAAGLLATRYLPG